MDDFEKHEQSSDSEESTVFDGASTKFRGENESDDESSIVVSSIQSRDDLNKESNDKPNLLTFNSIMQTSDKNSSKMKGVHITNCKNTVIGNETYFRETVTFNVHSEKRSNHTTKLAFTGTRKTNSTLNNKEISVEVNKVNRFRLKPILVPTITSILLVVSGAIYFTTPQKYDASTLTITSQRDEKLGNDSDYFTLTALTTVETRSNGIQRIDSGFTYTLRIIHVSIDRNTWEYSGCNFKKMKTLEKFKTACKPYFRIKFYMNDSAKITTSEFRIISRGEWEARQPKIALTDLQQPSTIVIIAHTVTSPCLTQDRCSSNIRAMQADHIQRGLEDISYNFLVGGDGSPYFGRGWEKEGRFSSRFTRNSICIAFIGTFTEIIPSQRQIDAAQNLIEEGVRLKKLVPDYRLYGHRQVSKTESPGEALYTIIKTWEHWSDIV